MPDLDVRLLSWPVVDTRKAFLRQVFASRGRLTLRAWLTRRRTISHVKSGKPIDVRMLPREGEWILSRLRRAHPELAASLEGETSPVYAAGNCLGAAVPDGVVGFTRRASLRSGEFVAFHADGIPMGMTKAFVGWRDRPEGREFVFLSLAPRFVMVVPGSMLRHIERLEFVTHDGSTVRPAGHCEDAATLATRFGLRDYISDTELPLAGGHREGLIVVLQAIRDRTTTLPDRPAWWRSWSRSPPKPR